MKISKENSQIVQTDNLTETTYNRNGFIPGSEVEEFTYTSHRVTKPVYNKYSSTSDSQTKVFGYYTDWSQYDKRLEDANAANVDVGRGVDFTKIPATAYDKLIIGFLGVVGDQGEKKDVIENAATSGDWANSPGDAAGFDRSDFQVTFTDPWGDVLSYQNCGFPGWVTNDVTSMYSQEKAHGMLGALRDMKKKNPALSIGISIGGWTMSNIFYSLARDESQRKIFAASIIDILKKFDMITDLDIDWEYPGMPGNTGNVYDDEDSQYFQLLIADVRAELEQSGFGDVKISIAANASVAGLEKADIPGLIASGVDGINLMTYDFFGTPWAESLAHHTNLYDYDSGEGHFNIKDAVDYLDEQGVDLKKVYLGYAAYSRNAKNAQIESFSPLKGSYDPASGTTTGSFESGATEYYDIIFNYLDLENQKGRSGFTLFTDDEADADYLYSPSSKLFMSIDTPRSVKAKGEFVRENGLGGLFTWTIDMDNGLLVNAAREGLGFDIENQVIDMAPFYFKGANSEVPVLPEAQISGNTQVEIGDTITLSAKNSTGATAFLWTAPKLSFNGSTDIDVTAAAETVGDFEVSLKITDDKGNEDTASVTVKVVDEIIPQWLPQDYPTQGTKVRNNYNNQGEHIYQNNWYANAIQEPGNPAETGGPGSGKVWTLIE